MTEFRYFRNSENLPEGRLQGHPFFMSMITDFHSLLLGLQSHSPSTCAPKSQHRSGTVIAQNAIALQSTLWRYAWPL